MEQFHDEDCGAVEDLEVVDADDVFVHEVAGPACLREEAVREARLEPRQDQLNRHLLAESYIECMEDDAHASAAAETQDLVALAERGAYELEVGVRTLLCNCPPLGDPRVNGAATGRAVAFARVRWEGGVTDGTVINLCGGACHVRERLDLRGLNRRDRMEFV